MSMPIGCCHAVHDHSRRGASRRHHRSLCPCSVRRSIDKVDDPMSPRDALLPAGLTGSALASAGQTALTPSRMSRRTALALDQLEQRSIVAEAAVTARAHLIGQATHASMRTSAAIHAEAVMLAQIAPAAADALAKIASASTAG